MEFSATSGLARRANLCSEDPTTTRFGHNFKYCIHPGSFGTLCRRHPRRSTSSASEALADSRATRRRFVVRRGPRPSARDWQDREGVAHHAMAQIERPKEAGVLQ
jgi:hypothetical protein